MTVPEKRNTRKGYLQESSTERLERKEYDDHRRKHRHEHEFAENGTSPAKIILVFSVACSPGSLKIRRSVVRNDVVVPVAADARDGHLRHLLPGGVPATVGGPREGRPPHHPAPYLRDLHHDQQGHLHHPLLSIYLVTFLLFSAPFHILCSAFTNNSH